LKKRFYYDAFEHRLPYSAIPANKYRTWLFQFTGVVTIVLGFAYLNWRWRFSLNPNALWFAIPLVLAESLSFIGTLLLVFNFWSNKDAEKTPPVRFLSEIEDLQGRADRAIVIDIFIATYNEDVELVRQSIVDAKKIAYPFPDVEIKVYVLDDGRRDGRNPMKENMKAVADQEEVAYLIRDHNEGYKAGNLKNGLKYTKGDLFVIFDADTRAFPEFLIHTTGYFRKRKVAWVQTPQWFYDTSEPRIIDFYFFRMKVNEDIFGNDPRLFYDVILRKRNYYNAAFCCGAGSVHRREAIMNLAVKEFADGIRQMKTNMILQHKSSKEIRKQTNELLLKQEIIPFKFHASEDIYTSIMLHADQENKWESIQHPDVECKMLSTQDLDSWVKQHQRYAEGSLDIAFKENPLFIKGLSIGQKICYFNTIWSYFAPLWILIFLLSPIIFFFTLCLPVKAYSFDFFKYFLPFQIMNTITITLGCWGIDTKRGDQYYISSFWFMLLAILSVARGKKVKFNVTPKDKPGVMGNANLRHVWPHMLIITLSLAGIAYNSILLAIGHHPGVAGFAANVFWCMFNISALSIMIRASYWKPSG